MTRTNRENRTNRTTIARMITIVIAGSSLAFGTTGCDALLGELTGPTGTTTYAYWITASQDAQVSCGRTAGCEEGDLNFGRHGGMNAAFGPLGKKRIYVDFPIPSFPEGTVVERAYMELYHPASNEDNAGDDVRLTVHPLFSTPWTESTITWNNRPDQITSTGTGPIDFKILPLDWSGTPDITQTVQRAVDAPGDFDGFLVTAPTPFFAQQIEKQFYTSNYFQRQRDTEDRAPRLLMIVTVPSGITGPLDPSQLLPLSQTAGATAPVRAYFQQGGEFPEGWNVRGR